MNKPGGIIQRLQIRSGWQILVRPEVQTMSQTDLASYPLGFG